MENYIHIEKSKIPFKERVIKFNTGEEGIIKDYNYNVHNPEMTYVGVKCASMSMEIIDIPVSELKNTAKKFSVNKFLKNVEKFDVIYQAPVCVDSYLFDENEQLLTKESFENAIFNFNDVRYQGDQKPVITPEGVFCINAAAAFRSLNINPKINHATDLIYKAIENKKMYRGKYWAYATIEDIKGAYEQWKNKYQVINKTC